MTYFQRLGLASFASGWYFLSMGLNDYERFAGIQWTVFGLWLVFIGSAMILAELLPVQ